MTNSIAFTLAAVLAALATGCASTTQYGSKLRAIDYGEASEFERTLQAKSVPNPPHLERLYVQPVNKNIPCKLPTTQEQQERGNFRAYWDGQCKDGFAFGLGRDIAISDTHHSEEITVHNGSGDNTSSPSVIYDFVNNRVQYVTPGEKYPAGSWFLEDIKNAASGFFISYSIGTTDESGKVKSVTYSPLRPERMFINDYRNVTYRFVDSSQMPAVDVSTIAFRAETLDPQSGTPGGVVIVRFANGQVRHLKLGGAAPEDVVLPPEYLNTLNEKLQATQNALPAAQVQIERARQMEREYLYMACNGKHSIVGLDDATATKICNWRGQFKEPFEKALSKYAQDMEQLKQRAEVAKQQLLAQQQLDVQQRQLQQQQLQQGLQQFANTLAQFGNQMQNTGQQMLNNAMSQPAPQVNFAPFTPSGSNHVSCVNAGSVTNCRY